MIDVMETLKKVIVDKGFKVAVGTPYCESHKSRNVNCAGCESEDGCSRYICLALLMTLPMVHESGSFEDFQKMNAYIQEGMEKITNPNCSEAEYKKFAEGR